MLAQEQQIRSSWSLYEMAGRSLTKSPRDEPYVQLRRLFVSAILSLISILISPVLSTDALWNVISANTANNADTTMAGYNLYPHFANLTVGRAYIFQVHELLPSNLNGYWIFKCSLTDIGPIKRGTATTNSSGFGHHTVRSVVLTEAKTMYAGGNAVSPNEDLQI